MRITVHAPTRVALVGGSGPHCLKPADDAGTTVHWALEYRCRVQLTVNTADTVVQCRNENATLRAQRPQDLTPGGPFTPIIQAVGRLGTEVPFHLATYSPLPPGSGLGARSSCLLAVCAALNVLSHRPLSMAQLILLAAELDARDRGRPAVGPDPGTAAWGGLAVWRRQQGWGPGTYRRQALPLSKTGARRLARHFLLAWPGPPGTGTPPDWDALLATARAAGALAGKREGTGAGGCLLLAVPPRRQAAVAAAVVAAGGCPKALLPARRGLQLSVQPQPEANAG